MADLDLSLSFLIHGEHGVGKSTLANTSPGPRCVLDAEGGSRFQEQKIVVWDPITEAPPEDDGSWELCLVYVRNFTVVTQAYAWLNSGKHPFRSLVIDSITEIQKRLIDQISGTDQMKTQDWGTLLRSLEDYVRKLRDLTFHPTHPLDTVTILAGTHYKDGKFRASVQGRLELTLPTFVDVVGYVYFEQGPAGELIQRMLVAPLNSIDAKCRPPKIARAYGSIITAPNLSEILALYKTPGGDN